MFQTQMTGDTEWSFKATSEEKPYKCDICEAHFADRANLKRHKDCPPKAGYRSLNVVEKCTAIGIEK